MRHTFTTLALAMLLSAATYAQTDSTANDDIRHHSARSLCKSYGVDTRMLDNQGNLRIIIDSLTAAHEHPYMPISTWCRQQQSKTNHMINSMRETLRWDGDMAWIDSNNCVTDAAIFVALLQRSAAWLESQGTFYEDKENDRVEQERRLREEMERREALRIQREKEERLRGLHDTINLLHRDITTFCDGKNVTDKRRRVELNSFYLAYKHIFNRYNTANSSVDESNFAQMEELKRFQIELRDSALGGNGLLRQIGNFESVLKVRADKAHSEVFKSYTKTFKKVEVPIDFTTLDEYAQYMNRLRDIRYVQNSYITVITKREEITRNTTTLQTNSKKRHDLFNAYKEVLEAQALVPAYSNRDDADTFIKHLDDFIGIQQSYMSAILRLDTIDRRSDSIVNACNKKISDVASAYKNLLDAIDFVPHLQSKANIDSYNNLLDDFEHVQSIYGEVIGMRNTIVEKDDVINNFKSSPKGLMAGYKLLKKNSDFTPHFATSKQGEDFKFMLNHHINIQDKYITILSNNGTIEANVKKLNTTLKEYKNLTKSFGIVMKSYNMEINVLTETDLDNYIRFQQEVMAMQQRYSDIVTKGEATEYNARLKKEKDPHNIKVLIGIND